MATCTQHDVETNLSCRTCGTPVCPDCAVRTAMGVSCAAHAGGEKKEAAVALAPKAERSGAGGQRLLIGGVAAWYAGTNTRVVGVEPAAAPTLSEALKAGRPVDAPAGGVAADSLAPRQVGALMFPIAQRHVDRVLLVEDDEIVRAQAVLWDTFRMLVEPGGAAAFAALLTGRYTPSPDEHVAVILCGGNTQRSS